MFKFDNKSLLYKSHLFENEGQNTKYGKIITHSLSKNKKESIKLFLENTSNNKSLAEQDLLQALENNKNEQEKLKWIKLAPIKKYIEEFLISKQLIIYGGNAINLALPKSKQFYKEDEIQDFDIYSLNAQKDAVDLCNYIHNKTKNPYIFVKTARHEGTYRIYYEWAHIVDISNVENKLFYNKLLKLTKPKYNKKFTLAPTEALKYSFHFELSKPLSSTFRWEKIYDRLKIFDSIYQEKNIIDKIKNIDKFLTACENIDVNCILDHIHLSIITENHVVVGTKAYIKYFSYGTTPIINKLNVKIAKNKFYTEAMNSNSTYLSILSDEPDTHTNFFLNIIKIYIKINLKHLTTKNYEIKIEYCTALDNICKNIKHTKTKNLFDKYIISIKINNVKYNLLTIHNATNTCYAITKAYSISKSQKFLIGTVDTLMSFTYFNILEFTSEKYNKNYLVLPEILSYMIYNNNEKNVKRTFDPACYGTEKSVDNVSKENWGKRQAHKKFKYIPGIKNPHHYI